MTDATETGVPYPSDQAGPVDGWSEATYAALRNWHVAQGGQWTRWEPGYVLLTITQVDGAEVEPIMLYTADEELTVTFGYWETHNPAPYELWDAKAEIIAEHAKLLVEQWLSGDVRTAVITDATGKWCGTIMIEPGELAPQLKAAAQWVGESHPEQIEVRTPIRRDWRSYPVEPDWRQQPDLDRDRLPNQGSR